MVFGEPGDWMRVRVALTCVLEYILQANETSRYPTDHRPPAPPARGGAYASHRPMGQGRSFDSGRRHACGTTLSVVQGGQNDAGDECRG